MCIDAFVSWSSPQAMRANTEIAAILTTASWLASAATANERVGRTKNGRIPRVSKSRNKWWIAIFFTRLEDILRRIKNIYQPMLTISLTHSWQQLGVKLSLRESYFGLISQLNYFPPKGMTHRGRTAVLWGCLPKPRQMSNDVQDFASGTLFQPCPSASWLKKLWKA